MLYNIADRYALKMRRVPAAPYVYGGAAVAARASTAVPPWRL
jgi:hypothetical protein